MNKKFIVKSESLKTFVEKYFPKVIDNSFGEVMSNGFQNQFNLHSNNILIGKGEIDCSILRFELIELGSLSKKEYPLIIEYEIRPFDSIHDVLVKIK